MVEPFSASSMRWWSEAYLRGLRELCTDEDIVLIFDEIYTGWGKTGSLFYFMRYPGLIPDIAGHSKSLGGGKASISGVHRPGADLPEGVRQPRRRDVASTSTTYYGFGEETATAIEAINMVVEEDFPARAREIERILSAGLERIQRRTRRWSTGCAGAGALWGVFLTGGPEAARPGRQAGRPASPDPQFRTKLVTFSVIAHLYRDHDIMPYYSPNGRNPLVVAPTLVIEPAELEHFLDALDETLGGGPAAAAHPVRAGEGERGVVTGPVVGDRRSGMLGGLGGRLPARAGGR